MPAPAPAATRVMRCPWGMRMIWPKVEPKRRADLDDRPLAAHGRSAADRDRRGERLHDGDNGTDHAAVVVDRIHDLGHAVPSCFRGEFGDEEGDADGPDHRHEDHEGSPRARRREDVGVVTDGEVAEEQQVVNETDQIAKRDRAEPGDDANHKGEEER